MGTDIAAYNDQGPCKPGLVLKREGVPSFKIVLPRVQLLSSQR